MTIADGSETGKGVDTGWNWKTDLARGLLPVAVLILASTGSFGLGVLAGREDGPATSGVTVEPAAPAAQIKSAPKETVPAAAGQYVGSKTGSKYYLPWCGTAKRIKEENKVWFSTKEEAEAAGYGPGKNCKGL